MEFPREGVESARNFQVSGQSLLGNYQGGGGVCLEFPRESLLGIFRGGGRFWQNFDGNSDGTGGRGKKGSSIVGCGKKLEQPYVQKYKICIELTLSFVNKLLSFPHMIHSSGSTCLLFFGSEDPECSHTAGRVNQRCANPIRSDSFGFGAINRNFGSDRIRKVVWQSDRIGLEKLYGSRI